MDPEFVIKVESQGDIDLVLAFRDKEGELQELSETDHGQIILEHYSL